MKVLMKEFYKDKSVTLAKGQTVEVSAELGAWLLQHRKAEQVHDTRHLDVEPQFEQAKTPPHYGAQSEPQPRDDESIYQNVKKPRKGRRDKE